MNFKQYTFLVNSLNYNTHTYLFNGPLSRITRVSRYQKGKTNLDFTEARDNEWQWHQLGRMQVCTLLQTDNHASTPPLSFLQAGCPSCCPTNSVKALKAHSLNYTSNHKIHVLLHFHFLVLQSYTMFSDASANVCYLLSIADINCD